MRKISYGINSYNKTASIIVKYANPFIFALDNIAEFVCAYLIPSLPLPNFRIKREGEETTVKERYGDFQSLFHLWIHCPILHYCTPKIDFRMIKIDYEEAKRVFYDKDKKFWDNAIVSTEE